MNTSHPQTLLRRVLTTAMLAFFGLAGWCWTHESSPKHNQATAATVSKLPARITAAANSHLGDSRKPITPKAKPRYVTKNIEDIQVGDYVLSREEHGDKIALRRVVEVYRRTSLHLRHLTFESEDGTTQSLQTTDEHPFWNVTKHSWIEAGHFVVGDCVTTPHGYEQRLIATDRSEHPAGVSVFNFQVEGWHTYFVATDFQNAPVLAHNSNCVWYHGTDSGSVSSISQGLNEAAIKARGGDTRGFFVTKNLADAEDYARLVAKERGGSPVVLQASGSRIGHLLDDVPGAIGGERMIPVSLFPNVPIGSIVPK